MKSQEDKKVKYNTYIPNDVVQALKNLAHKKRVSAGYVIESAIRKCIPENIFMIVRINSGMLMHQGSYHRINTRGIDLMRSVNRIHKLPYIYFF